MNYFKICIEQIRQDSLLTSAVSSPLIFIGLCWSEINAESTVRCKSCRLLHKQDTAEQNKFFPKDILCPPVCQDHTNTVELLLSQMLLSELLMGQNQRPSSARDTGWIMDWQVLPGKVQSMRKSEEPQLARGGLLPILRPKILLCFFTILHYENSLH